MVRCDECEDLKHMQSARRDLFKEIIVAVMMIFSGDQRVQDLVR
jgi:hypothetical protein